MLKLANEFNSYNVWVEFMMILPPLPPKEMEYPAFDVYLFGQ